MRTRASKKGLSAVLGAVLIVATAIALALSASLWLPGIVTVYGRHKTALVTGIWTKKNVEGDFLVNLTFKNTGDSRLKIVDAILNGKPFREHHPETSVKVHGSSGVLVLNPSDPSTFYSVEPGEKVFIEIQIPGDSCSSGQSIDARIREMDGVEFPLLATLP